MLQVRAATGVKGRLVAVCCVCSVAAFSVKCNYLLCLL